MMNRRGGGNAKLLNRALVLSEKKECVACIHVVPTPFFLSPSCVCVCGSSAPKTDAMSTLIDPAHDYELVDLTLDRGKKKTNGNNDTTRSEDDDSEEDDADDENVEQNETEPGGERWIQSVSIAADEASSANISFSYMVMSIMTSKIADGLLSGYILPSTDQFLLVAGFAFEAVVLLKVLGYAVVALLFKNDRSKMGTWFHSVVLILNFLFFITFWLGYGVIIIMFSTLFQITTASATAAALLLVYSSIAILFLLGHTSFGLISHRAVVVTEEEYRSPSKRKKE